MAQANNIKGFWPASEAVPNYYNVAASQTIAQGDVVYLDSNQIKIAVAGTAAVCGVAAQASSSQAENTRIAIWDNPLTQFIATMDGDSSSVTAETLVDLVGTTGAHQLDADASTTDIFIMMAPLKDDDTSAAGCRWRHRINPAKHQLHL